jgi:hypothetical protein
MYRYPAPIPTLAQQALRLKSTQPGASVRFDHRGNRLIWLGSLRPTPMSDRYTTRIIYARQQLQPRIFVVEPALVERGGKAIPHLYSDGGLCLWQPAYREWRPSYWIAETIIGWASLWLFFYEVWHGCGEWLGGGEHPRDANNHEDQVDARE